MRRADGSTSLAAAPAANVALHRHRGVIVCSQQHRRAGNLFHSLGFGPPPGKDRAGFGEGSEDQRPGEGEEAEEK